MFGCVHPHKWSQSPNHPISKRYSSHVYESPRIQTIYRKLKCCCFESRYLQYLKTENKCIHLIKQANYFSMKDNDTFSWCIQHLISVHIYMYANILCCECSMYGMRTYLNKLQHDNISIRYLSMFVRINIIHHPVWRIFRKVSVMTCGQHKQTYCVCCFYSHIILDRVMYSPVKRRQF